MILMLPFVYDKYANSNLAKDKEIGIETYIAPLKTHSVVFDTFHKTRFQLILPVDSQKPPKFKVVIHW